MSECSCDSRVARVALSTHLPHPQNEPPMSVGELKLIQILVVITLRLWHVIAGACIVCLVMFLFYNALAAMMFSVISFVLILYHAEDHLVYHPTFPLHSRLLVPRPSGQNLPYENIKCPSKDGTAIHMYLILQPSNSENVPTVLFLHGNAGNIGHRLQNAAGLYYNLCVNVLMVEYRGYGLSDGSPSESGLYMDAKAAVDYLHSRSDIDRSRIVVFGRSLGGAVAIDLVSMEDYRNRVWCLIVENTFTSIPDMAEKLLSWKFLGSLPSVCYKNKFASIDKIRRVVLPSLFICGQADSLVPPTMGEALHSRCNASFKKLARVPSGGHNDTWTCAGYYDIIKNFLLEAPLIEKVPIKSTILQI